MKRINMMMLTWMTCFALLSSLVCKAETKVPCLIFSGNAEKEQSIDLSKFNRITFGENSMVISSTIDGAQESVELLYSLYHHIKIGDATPDAIVTGIESIDIDSGARIIVDGQSRLMHVESPTDNQFSAGIFSISGNLVLTAELRCGEAVSLTSLTPGVYIAVATDGQTELSLKFILE